MEGNLVSTLLMMGAIFFIFYFLLIRPQRKREAEHRKMQDGISRGDRIVTNGGVLGKVISATDKKLVIETAVDTRLELDRGGIASKREAGAD